MTSRQNSFYTMLRRLLAFLKRNTALFPRVSVMDNLITDLEAYLIQIDSLKEQQGTDISGVRKQKGTIRLTATQKALEVSKALLVYAKTSGNEVLAQKINYTERELIKYSDNNLDTAFGVILTSAQHFQTELMGYGVTPENVLGFKAAVDAFKAAMGSPKDGTIARKQITERLFSLFEQQAHVLEKIDLLMETLKFAHPALYGEYQDNRRVENRTGSLSLRMSITDATTAHGLWGVNVTFMLDGVIELEKTSAEAGGFSVKSLVEGIYVLTLSKIGYQTQTITVNVSNGDLNVIEVGMKKVIVVEKIKV